MMASVNSVFSFVVASAMLLVVGCTAGIDAPLDGAGEGEGAPPAVQSPESHPNLKVPADYPMSPNIIDCRNCTPGQCYAKMNGLDPAC